MYTYEQKSGKFSKVIDPTDYLNSGIPMSNNLQLLAYGYSGHGEGKNNPDLQEEQMVGPIPKGRYLLKELLEQTKTHGPHVIRLEALPGTNTFGRSGFLIHGDNTTHTASEGCIILPPNVRFHLEIGATLIVM